MAALPLMEGCVVPLGVAMFDDRSSSVRSATRAPPGPVVTPITSQRSAVTTVYLKHNHSLLIGGLKSVTTFQSETKVPILGDIPLLGFLFRSTSTSRQETSVAFQITPRIVNDRGSPTEREQ